MRVSIRKATRRLLPLPLAALLSAAALGCGPGKAPVSGSVTLDGKPLPAGTIAFLPAKGQGASAEIKDGAYTATDVPIGEVRVVVDTSALKRFVDEVKKGNRGPEGSEYNPASASKVPPEAKEAFEKQLQASKEAAANAKEMAAKYRPLPDRYNDPAASGLTFTVKPGQNEYNVPLTSK